MRMRRSSSPPTPTPTALLPSSSSPVLQPCCSSSSSCTSTLSSHSLSSTCSLSSSSSSSTPLSTTTTRHRCEGLDLLVKAVYHVVAGSTVAVPYIQRRIIRRRKPALKFTNLLIHNDHHLSTDHNQGGDNDDDHGDVFDGSTKLSAVVMKMKMQIKRRSKGGSVLKSLKPGKANQRKSVIKKKTKIKLGN